MGGWWRCGGWVQCARPTLLGHAHAQVLLPHPCPAQVSCFSSLLYSRAKQSERLGTGRMQPGHGRLSARPPRQATPRLCP